MSLLSIKDHFYNLKKIHNILPTYYIDFENNIYAASCIYNDVLLESSLKRHEIRHIDSDYLYFDVAILLTEKLNRLINNSIKSTIT